MTELVRRQLASIGREAVRPSEANGGRCFIVTAVYGNANHLDVLMLRAFRDEVLSHSVLGRRFVDAYNFISPFLAAFIRTHRTKIIIRSVILQPVISVVRNQLEKRGQ